MLYEVLPENKTGEPDTAVLRLEVDSSEGSQVFRDGRLRLRCTATQFLLYRQVTELDVMEDRPVLQPVLGPTIPHQGGNRKFPSSSLKYFLTGKAKGDAKECIYHKKTCVVIVK